MSHTAFGRRPLFRTGIMIVGFCGLLLPFWVKKPRSSAPNVCCGLERTLGEIRNERRHQLGCLVRRPRRSQFPRRVQLLPSVSSQERDGMRVSLRTLAEATRTGPLLMRGCSGALVSG